MSATTAARPLRLDLLRLPLVGRFLRWRHCRTALQAPLLLVAALVLYDGFFGPALAPKNVAGVVPWVHWRGLVVLALLLVGNVFCLACPFMLPRRLAKRLLSPKRVWPRRLRAKWLAVALLLALFWAYEALDLWASPWLTAWLALAYFLGAFAVDGLFRGAAFCKYLCPIGQFNYVNSLVSPFEVAVREPGVCAGCASKACIKGASPADGRPTSGGCELWLFQERKVGNMDCTFCLDCVHACPHDNVGVIARTPAGELWRDPVRSGIGRLDRRPDLAALALVLVFAAFTNAFGMVAPVYEVERRLASALGTSAEPLVLLVVFGLGLVAIPLVAVGLAALASRALAGSRASVLATAVRYSYALVPIGFAMWFAHYAYHFLTGALTIVPVAQSFLADLGLPLLGAPRWGLGPLVPAGWLLPIELVALEAGLIGSLIVAYRIARADRDAAAWRGWAPWALLCLLLFAAGAWLMTQPMEMRGTFGGG